MSRARRALSMLFVLPGSLAAQMVMGRVVDSAAHRPVVGLTVRLVAAPESARDTVVASTQTDSGGAFLLNARKPGTYRVRLGDAYLGPPLTLADVDAEDQHEYVLAPVRPVRPVPPADTVRRYHVLHGAELENALHAGTPLLACEVEKQAAFVPRTVAMRFPPALREHQRTASQRTGSVFAEFVIDTLAHLETATLRISRSPNTDEAFVASVAQGLAQARFYAAVSDGRKVRQRMFVPVTFRLDSEAPPPLLQGSPCGPISRDDAVSVVSGFAPPRSP